jgi:hypothetical protein
MEVTRRSEKNKLYVEKQCVEKSLQRDIETVLRLKNNSSADNEFAVNRIIQLKESIVEKECRISKICDDISNIDIGVLDEEITQRIKIAEKEVKRKVLESKKIKESKKQEKEEEKGEANEYWSNILSSSRAYSQQQRDIRYFYKQFGKIEDSLPDYIKKNLSEMPNNKGYIWRGCHFYGDLKIQNNQPQIMFEKCKGNILKIVETTESEQKIFDKIGKNKKTLFSQTRRKQKNNCGASLLDYIKK